MVRAISLFLLAMTLMVGFTSAFAAQWDCEALLTAASDQAEFESDLYETLPVRQMQQALYKLVDELQALSDVINYNQGKGISDQSQKVDDAFTAVEPLLAMFVRADRDYGKLENGLSLRYMEIIALQMNYVPQADYVVVQFLRKKIYDELGQYELLLRQSSYNN